MYDGASLMTLSERGAYLDPGAGGVNVLWGYPEGLSPGWVRELQVGPPGGFLDQRPGEYEAVIRGYFAGFFGCPAGGVSLAPSATMAFAVAVQAIMGSPGDEFVLADCSYDSYPGLLGALGARVRYARRQAGGVLDVASVAAACTARTRAVVVVSPDNPLGVVCPPQVWEQLIALCRERGITLLADHCLAEVNPRGVPVPVLPSLAAGRGLSWMAVGDTGKVLGLGGTKFGALACSQQWREAVEWAASNWFFQHRQYDLAVVAAIVSDRRFVSYRRQVSDQVRANYEYLRRELAPPLAVQGPGGGCFCLIDAAGLGTDDVSYAALLRDRYQALVVPVSWFPAGQAARETRVRVSLNRSGEVIAALAEVLNASAASAGKLAS